MMKLNADMKCMGLGLYLETILFLRKQQEYKHDFNELDLLADQWGATVENLQHLIKDFDLFLITEDGYFRCLYLDEVMGYQSKLSEQRAAAGSKGGRSSKKSTVKASAKATASTIGRGRINEGKNGDTSCMDRNEEIYTKSNDAPCMDNNKEVYLKSSGAPSMDSKERIYMESSNVDSNKTVCMESSKPIHSDYNKEIYKENSTESNVKSSAESMKNTTAKNTNENSVKNVIQSVDNECYGKNLQASFKQSFIREEKNRGEKKKKDDAIEIKAYFEGTVLPLEKVNDPMFSDKLMGDGVAIEPDAGNLYAPVDGKVASIFDTKHAIGFVLDNGAEVLMHIGMDTVELNGEGFDLDVSVGDEVHAGELMGSIDLDFVKSKGKETVTPIVLTAMDEYKIEFVKTEGHVNIGDVLYKISK